MTILNTRQTKNVVDYGLISYNWKIFGIHYGFIARMAVFDQPVSVEQIKRRNYFIKICNGCMCMPTSRI